MNYYVDGTGAYLGCWDIGGPVGGIQVPSAPSDARQPWLGDRWGSVVMTEEEMKESEIAQDKEYLAKTDYIVLKISEASATGQDTAPLLEQYAEQLSERESARVRIRLNEGRN